MTAPARIAVVMACHNRRALTLRCLASLYAQQSPDLVLAVHLLDDGSSDGTGAAIARDFPQVTLLSGDGNRFWGGGMFDAMRSAGASGYDFMLWLNDDVLLDDGALAALLDAHGEARRIDAGRPHIIVGACLDPESGRARYGGMRRLSRWHPARLAPVPPDPAMLAACDTMNGNCVLVPVAVVRKIGFIDPVFAQQIGDADYGLRAARAGVALWVARRPVGQCSLFPKPTPWRDASLGLRARWRLLDAPLAYPIRPWVRFMWRHGGVAAVLAFAVRFARELFPSRRARCT